MIPSRTSHSSSIGPGVVPRGADPLYDEEVKREYDLRKNVPHVGKGLKGRPFSIAPNGGAMTRTQCVFYSSLSLVSNASCALLRRDLIKNGSFGRLLYFILARDEKGERERFFEISHKCSSKRPEDDEDARKAENT